MTTTRRSHGFTLIELMITVAIVAILAAIAYPSYAAYILRSHRTDATSALAYCAQRMERVMSQSGTYVGQTLGSTPTDICLATSENGYYTLAFAPEPTATSFTLTATPVGTQAADTCGVYSYNDQGIKTAVGGTSTCW